MLSKKRFGGSFSRWAWHKNEVKQSQSFAKNLWQKYDFTYLKAGLRAE